MIEVQYDRGTLLLTPQPTSGKKWREFVIWDRRVEQFRALGCNYKDLLKALQQEEISFVDQAEQFSSFKLNLYSKQDYSVISDEEKTFRGWVETGRRGTFVVTELQKLALVKLAIKEVASKTLIIAPTQAIAQRWLLKLKPVLRGNVKIASTLKDRSIKTAPILIISFNLAAILSEEIGNQYSLLIIDEYLLLSLDTGSWNFIDILKSFIAPFRLGISTFTLPGQPQEILNFLGATIYCSDSASSTENSEEVDSFIDYLTSIRSDLYSESEQLERLVIAEPDFGDLPTEYEI
jgi:hypothetical protein